MFIVQSVQSHDTWVCTKLEAWFWASLNETFYHGLHFNIYRRGGSMNLLSATEIANHA